MRMVVNSLVLAFPNIYSLIAVIFLIWLIFGILRVNLFAGKFYACNDPAITVISECVGDFVVTTASISDEAYGVLPVHATLPRAWENQPYHFDNVLHAMVSLVM